MTKTIPFTHRVKVPREIYGVLDDLLPKVLKAARGMIENRHLNSSKYWKEIPCVVANTLMAKYQKNLKCKKIKNIVIPICGTRGAQVKAEGNGIRVYRLFKKFIIPLKFVRPTVGYIRHIEFFKRDGDWFVSVCTDVACEKEATVDGVVGIDRNSVGNVAVMADLQNGKVFKLGIDPAGTKRCFKGRRGNLQKEKKNGLLRKIKRIQSRRMTCENHRASKTVVDYAVLHRRAIVLEDLSRVMAKRSKIQKYVQQNQWAFAQLEKFIKYKAALHGIPVISVNPAYTSQMCSRCGNIQKPDGKRYACKSCGHRDHRDANAAFNIGRLGAEVVRASGGIGLSAPLPRSRGGPYAGKDSRAISGVENQNSDCAQSGTPFCNNWLDPEVNNPQPETENNGDQNEKSKQ